MNAEELFEKLGSVLQLKIKLNKDNICRIRFDKDAVDFEVGNKGEKDEFIMLIAEYTPAPLNNREEFFSRVLAANLFGSKTGYASFGLDEERDLIIMHCILDLPMDYSAFEKKLEQFLLSLRFWQENLPELQNYSYIESAKPGMLQI